MANLTEEQVREVLAAVAGPGGGDIVSQGMVSGIAVRDGNVGFSIEVDPANAAACEPVREAAEAAVAALPGVLSVTAVLTAERPPQNPGNPGATVAGAGGAGIGKASTGAADTGERPLAGVEHIVAVASGKGGVGKSTCAVNLALALAGDGLRVGLLDADIYGPSQPRMMGISGRPGSPDGKILDPMENHGIKVMSIGFLVPEEQPMIWRGPMVMSALQQMIRDVRWGSLDVMIVDMPPGTGDAQLTMAQQVPLAGAVIVSTPQDIALIDARKGLNMFRKVDVPVLGIVENMSYFACPQCGHETPVFGRDGARDEAGRLGVPFLGGIPLAVEIRTTSDGGVPIVVSEPDSLHAAAFRDIAAQIRGALAQSGRAAPAISVE